MQRALELARERDPLTAQWLEVIDRFDLLVAGRASLDELAAFAAEASGRSVGVEESWNERRAFVVVDADAGRWDGKESARARTAVEAAIAQRLRGRKADVLTVADGEILAASVEVGAGRVGTAWLESSDAPWSARDHLVIERLAHAVALDALHLHRQRVARTTVDPAAIETLLGGAASEQDRVRLARQVGLDVSGRYTVLALWASPVGAASPDAVAEIATRAFARHGAQVRTAALGRLVAVIAPPTPGVWSDLAERTAHDRRGFRIEVGVGTEVAVDAIPESWDQAREALSLRSLVTPDGTIARFEDLGILHLLARIPVDDVLAFKDFVLLSELDATNDAVSDLRLLELYLDHGSLRQVAEIVFLHYTSVAYRLRKISERLDISLNDPGARLRLQLTIKLLHIHRTLGIAAPPPFEGSAQD